MSTYSATKKSVQFEMGDKVVRLGRKAKLRTFLKFAQREGISVNHLPIDSPVFQRWPSLLVEVASSKSSKIEKAKVLLRYSELIGDWKPSYGIFDVNCSAAVFRYGNEMFEVKHPSVFKAAVQVFSGIKARYQKYQERKWGPPACGELGMEL